MLTVGSLFSGIGGFDLGLERTGHMRTLWFCEQNPYRRAVLAKHWPGVPIHDDVRALVADTDGEPDQRSRRDMGRRRAVVAAVQGQSESSGVGETSESSDETERPMSVPVPYVDVLCGGFPCQDLSVAGKGAGIEGARSGLWAEFARIIGELRPRYVIVENVPALLARGMGRVLGDLAACGYDAEWDCIPASALGAPHRRDRVWIVAYPYADEGRCEVVGEPQPAGVEYVGDESDRLRTTRSAGAVGYPNGERPQGRGRHDQRARERVAGQAGTQPAMADATGEGRHVTRSAGEALLEPRAQQRPTGRGGGGEGMGNADSAPANAYAEAGASRQAIGESGRREPESDLGLLAHGFSPGLAGWDREPDIPRVAKGVPNRVDRLAALGDALVPQIAEYIGRRIMEWEG